MEKLDKKKAHSRDPSGLGDSSSGSGNESKKMKLKKIFLKWEKNNDDVFFENFWKIL